MLRRTVSLGFVAATLLGPVVAPLAGCSRPQPQQAAPAAEVAEIRSALLAETGYPTSAIEVEADRIQVTITIVNSPLSSRPAIEREHEARRMVQALVRAARARAAFAGVHTVHIDYVISRPDGSGAHAVDAIDFRKDAAGVFQLHQT